VNQTINGRSKFVSAGIVSYGGKFELPLFHIYYYMFYCAISN